MNPIDPQTLARGLDWARYRAGAEKNLDILDEVHARPEHTAAELAWLGGLPPLTVVAIGEDWCPDVVHTLPTWVRIAEALDGWRCAIFPRDEHPELMEAFLYRGRAKRVPVYAFYDQRGYLQTWWSGRSAIAQQAWDGWLAGRAYADLDKEEGAAIGRRLQDGYRQRFRRANFEEILRQLAAFFHREAPV